MVGDVDNVVAVFELETERERRVEGGLRRCLRALEALQAIDGKIAGFGHRAARTSARDGRAGGCDRAAAGGTGSAVHVAEIAHFRAAAYPKGAAARGLLHRVDERLHACVECTNTRTNVSRAVGWVSFAPKSHIRSAIYSYVS